MYIEYLCVSMQFSSLCMRKIGAVPVGFFPSRGMKCETPVFKPYDQTSNFIQRSANTNTGKHMKQASTGWPRIHIYIERIVYIYIFEYTVQCKHYIVIHTYIYICHLYPLLCISHVFIWSHSNSPPDRFSQSFARCMRSQWSPKKLQSEETANFFVISWADVSNDPAAIPMGIFSNHIISYNHYQTIITQQSIVV